MNKKEYKATWELITDPMYWVECPHCKNTIIMSKPKIIERLKRWAKHFNK